MSWTDSSKTLPDNLNWLNSIFFNRKADKITPNFFPAVHISFRRQSYFGYLEN